jgi:hypothetical protein
MLIKQSKYNGTEPDVNSESSTSLRNRPVAADAEPRPRLPDRRAGRPKAGDWRACYALIDPESANSSRLAVEFVRLEFDFERLQRALAATPLITSFDGPAAGP